jgi:hypothetical protein
MEILLIPISLFIAISISIVLIYWILTRPIAWTYESAKLVGLTDEEALVYTKKYINEVYK